MNKRTQRIVGRTLVATSLVAAGALLVLASDYLVFGAQAVWTGVKQLQAPLVIIASIATPIAAFMAYLQKRSETRLALRQTTLARIMEDHADPVVVHQRTVFRTIKNSKGDKLGNYLFGQQREEFIAEAIKNYLSNNKVSDRKARKVTDRLEAEFGAMFDERQTAIFGVFNRYETFAIGINEGAVDENLYKRWWRSSLLADFDAAREAIDMIRAATRSPMLFKEFEGLARKWKTELSEERSEQSP